MAICFLVISCKNTIPFNKTGWNIQGDLGWYPNRDKMLEDLLKNQKLIGLTYKQLIEKIGEPETYQDGDKNSIYFDIITDYGHEIDPVYFKTLEFKFNKDSIITSFKVKEINN